MFKEHSTEKLIEYIQSLPDKDQKHIIKSLSSAKTKKTPKTLSVRTEQDVLDTIGQGLKEIKEAKRNGKPLKNLKETLHELKSRG